MEEKILTSIKVTKRIWQKFKIHCAKQGLWMTYVLESLIEKELEK